MKNMTRLYSFRVLLLGLVCFVVASGAKAQSRTDAGWPTYGNDAGGTRYSAAAQINRSNVDKLKVVWTYRTGALEQSKRLIRKAAFEATPILVDGKLFLSTPYNHVIALDPATGTKLWEYDPGVNLEGNYSEVSSRGVSGGGMRKEAAPRAGCTYGHAGCTADCFG
jgi:quinoprotein glucose dehydrogenase